MSFQPDEILSGIEAFELFQSEGDTAAAMSVLDEIISDLELEFEHGGSDLRSLLVYCQRCRT